MTLEAVPRFPVRNESEVRTVTFDFSADLESGETLTGEITITVTPEHGSKAGSSVVTDGAEFDDTNKMVLVPTGPAPVADYLIKVECHTTNPTKVLVLSAVLPVAK